MHASFNDRISYLCKMAALVVALVSLATIALGARFQSVLPVNTRRLAYPGLKGHNPQVRALNARLVRLCDAKPWCTFVDLAPLLSDADGELRIDLTKDGIHLHPAGYVIWTDYLKKQKYLK